MVANTTKLTRIGNSTGVTLARDILQQAGLARGDEVAILAEHDRIIIMKADADLSGVNTNETISG